MVPLEWGSFQLRMVIMSEENACVYRQFFPNDALAPYVECFWILEAPSSLSTGSECLPADGRVEVMFHLAGPSKRYRADGQGEPHVQRTSSILGGRSRGYIVEQIGASHYVAIRFRPGGISPFINIPLTDIVDQVVNLRNGGDCLLSSGEYTLHHNLYDFVHNTT